MLSADDYKKLTDEELVALYKQSEQLDVIGELYQRYTSLVFGVCLKYLKDREESRDAVMQVFEKLIVSLKEHAVSQFKGWLYVTARNHCLMQLRSKKGKNFEEISPFIMETDPEAHLQDVPEIETNLSKLEKCIETLGEEQKLCVRLFYLEQKCYKEITEITGFDLNKVKSHIQNGKRNLKICMERNGQA
ncbi:sigma-70 family RNA polymerase sigma factor [Fulvivirgaceae bacterium PWU4]|uniref:Sigma-70 family RNA polymerase sigma factor n=1 Tax=Chryseosolibacter histidini TaxID=2782349 RepID=A0AAP2DSC9_9BACT|nr:sigma-70 family RNA polymerase sigma factor [Chryseosolibacter histidini]MBT1699584.1 sigma-70 family RNA polymerase sigma factor [Chryseosolibacter histidini]